MSKHVRIEVNGIEWVSGEFDEIGFIDGPAGVKLEAKTKVGLSQEARPTGKSSGLGSALMDLLVKKPERSAGPDDQDGGEEEPVEVAAQADKLEAYT